MPAQEKALHIDIPVKLEEVKNVFSIASLSFEGDLPATLFHLGLIMDDIADWKGKFQVVANFHTNAGHATLDDQAYNIVVILSSDKHDPRQRRMQRRRWF